MDRRRALVLYAFVAALSAACAKRVTPSAPPDVRSDDPAVQAKFQDARRDFERGRLDEAALGFDALLEEHPRDAVAAAAALYRARIALRRGEPERARRLLQPQVAQGSAVRQQALFYLGLAEARTGHEPDAVEHLRPLIDRVDAAALPGLLAALARSEARNGDTTAAIAHAQRLHALTERGSERAFARQLLQRQLPQLDDDALRAALSSAVDDSLLAAMASYQLHARAKRSGRGAEAARLAAEHRSSWRTHRLTATTDVIARPAAGRLELGVLVPRRGPFRDAGRLFVAGAVTGSGAIGGATVTIARATAKPATLLVRNSSDHSAAAAARALLAHHGVVAFIGPLAPRAATAVAPLAEQHSIATLTLAARGSDRSPNLLSLLPDNERRAERLARQARQRGARAAILAPRGGFGRTMSDAFSRAFQQSGGKVVARRLYPPTMHSFAPLAKSLAEGPTFDVLFVPDSAARLALIAPAIANAGLSPVAPGAKPLKGRPIALLATADGIDDGIVRRAGRYLSGALVAPGYYPDPTVKRGNALLRAFEKQHGHKPRLIEALAVDAVAAVRYHVERGARTPRELLAALRRDPFDGLTGQLRFDRTGARADPPLLYRIGDRSISEVSP